MSKLMSKLIFVIIVVKIDFVKMIVKIEFCVEVLLNYERQYQNCHLPIFYT